MLVGSSGCGKGAIFRELFTQYANDQELLEVAVTTVSAPDSSHQPAIQTANAPGVRRKASSSATPLLTTVQATHFNFYTSSEIFQKMLDRPLEKKSGRCYAPSGPKRRLIYFVNDLNMPEVDEYGTVQPHTIMRQFMDYRQWYL